MLGCPDNDPSNFVELNKPWAGCVWELAVMEHRGRRGLVTWRFPMCRTSAVLYYTVSSGPIGL